MNQFSAKSREASHLRRRKYELVRQYGIPENAVPRLRHGRRKCGRAGCHCAEDGGHPQWSLVHSRGGERAVEHVPGEWVEDLERAVLETQAFLAAAQEVMAINLELLAITRRQRQQRRRTSRTGKRPAGRKNAEIGINAGGQPADH